MKSKGFFSIIIFVLFGGLCVSGCSRGEELNNFNIIQVSNVFHEAGFVRVVHEEPDFVYESQTETAGYLGDTLYMLQTYDIKEKQLSYLEKYHLATGERERWEVSSTNTQVPFGSAVSIDALSEDKIQVLFAETDGFEGELCHYLSLLMNDRGEILSKIVLEDEYIQKEGNLRPALYCVDSEGNIYILNSGKNILYIFDNRGALCFKQEYSKPEDKVIGGSCHTVDGDVLLAVGNWKEVKTQLVRLGAGKKSFDKLASLKNGIVEHLFSAEDGTIYYIMNKKLIRWFPNEDKQEEIFSFMESTIPIDKICSMQMTDTGEILICTDKQQEKEIYVLSSEEYEAEGGLTVVNLANVGSNYVKANTAAFSRLYPDMQVQYISATGEKEAFKERTMADIAAGKGPDILWVEKKDMQMLYEKGVLADLTALISEETLQQIFRGVIQSGCIEDCFVGLIPEAQPMALMTSDTLWQEEHWDFSDFFTLLEDSQPCGILTVYGNNDGLNEKLNLIYLLTLNFANSPFVNTQTGESLLEGEEFQRVLEDIKMYSGRTPHEGENTIKDGAYIAQICQILHIMDFSNIMKEYGDECHFVGLPGQLDFVGYWVNDTFLVVNSQSDKKKDIGLFLEYLLNEENQQNVEFNSVRRDVIRQSVYIDEYSKKPLYHSRDGSYALEIKTDGSSYLEEYLEFLEKCGPKPYSLTDIEEIVLEEAQIYFDGTRNAQQTAKVIDNRVQLYLDESK